jgi:hypothetical protein
VTDENAICHLLELSGIPSRKALQRGIWVVEDLKWINLKTFATHVTHSGLVDVSSGKEIPLVEYSFGKTQFGVDNARNLQDKRSRSIGGTLLNRGNLQFLSIVSELGRRFLPHLWLKDEDLKFYLRTPVHHLNALNVTAVDIQSRHHMHAGPEDIDWRFRLDGTDLWINLEVKNRPGDVSRHHHGVDLGASDWLVDITKKFIPSGVNEINVVGLTLFGQIDRHVQEQISQWLDRNSVIDGILIWSHEGRKKSLFDRQLKGAKAQMLSTQIVTEPLEERGMIICNEVVLDRKYWPDKMLDSLPPDL